MRLQGKLQKTELEEVCRLLPSYWCLFKVSLRGWPSLLLLMALLWGTIAKMIVGDREHWLGLAITWTVIAAGTAWMILSSQRSQSHALQSLNRDLPEKLVLDAQGIHVESEDAVTYSRQWTTISAWREGDTVDILSLRGRRGFVFIPLSDLSPYQRWELGGLLRQNLGDPQTTE